MKTLYSFPLTILFVFSFWFWSVSCSSTDRTTASQQNDFALATSNYTVLAEKAISYQADFNVEAWGDLLADDVEYIFPNNTKWVGKKAVTEGWKKWQQLAGIQSATFSDFTHVPVQSTKTLPLSGLPGVYVLSFFTGNFRLINGNTASIKVNICCHFNKKNLIDRYSAYYDPAPLHKAMKRGLPLLSAVQSVNR